MLSEPCITCSFEKACKFSVLFNPFDYINVTLLETLYNGLTLLIFVLLLCLKLPLILNLYSEVFIMCQAIQLSKFDYRLANKLETDLQKLRCRVNYHALKFTDPIQKMGEKLVNRMRAKSNHYIALHLRYVMISTWS